MSRYQHERQYSAKENTENSKQKLSGPSPIKKRIMNRLPIETIFDDIKEIIRVDYTVGKQIYMAIREYFYVAYRRDTGTNDNSILTGIDRELRTGRPIRGLDHKIKAACTYKCVAKAIDKINGLLATETEYLESLTQFQLYLTTLNSRLARELIQIPDQEKRDEIKRKTGLDLDLLTVEPIASPHKRALEMFHESPKKNPDGNTPKKVSRTRRQAQWGMALFIDEEKERRKTGNPTSAADLFGAQKSDHAEVDFSTGLPPWASPPDASLAVNTTAPATKPEDRPKVSFKIKPKSKMTLNDKRGKPFSLFTQIAKESERERAIQAMAESSGIQLGHNH